MKNRKGKSRVMQAVVNISMTILLITLVALIVSVMILGIVNIWRLIGV